MKKKLLLLMFVVYLIFNQTLCVYADVAGLTVVGGSIATGGLGAAAAVGGGPISLVALAAVGVGLTAAGLNVELTEASQAAGMTKTDFILSKLEEWGNAGDRSLNQINETIASGVSIGKDGVLHLTNQASKQIEMFGNWLFESDNVISDSNVNTNEVVTLGDYNLPYSNSILLSDKNNQNLGYVLSVVGGSKAACFIYKDSQGYYRVSLISNSSFSYTITTSSSTYERSSTKQRNYYYALTAVPSFIPTAGVDSLVTNPDLSFLYDNTINTGSFINSLDGSFDINEGGILENTFTGDESDWREKAGLLNPTDGQTAINPNILSGINAGGVTGTIDISDYIGSIVDVINGTLPKDIPYTDVSTGITGTVEIPQVIPWDPTIDVTPELDIPSLDDTPALAPDKQADPDESIPSYTISGLQGIFPFCLPFDIYHMLQKLSADPVAPNYTVNWYIPIVDTDLNFTIDLTRFNSVAQVLRTMELIAFCIGLAFVTRSLIRG